MFTFNGRLYGIVRITKLIAYIILQLWLKLRAPSLILFLVFYLLLRALELAKYKQCVGQKRAKCTSIKIWIQDQGFLGMKTYACEYPMTKVNVLFTTMQHQQHRKFVQLNNKSSNLFDWHTLTSQFNHKLPNYIRSLCFCLAATVMLHLSCTNCSNLSSKWKKNMTKSVLRVVEWCFTSLDS